MQMDMQNKINYAVKKYGLDHLAVIYEHSAKGVFSAESSIFGPVILKLNQQSALLKSEYQMLARLSGRYCCKVYAFDESAGLLLEERIFPGTVLRREASLEKRIQIFLQVFHEIHMPANSGATYLNWLKQAHKYCILHHTAEDMASRAYLFCAEIFEKYSDRVLLHGDLHHDNLLLRADGSYAMIDPKGVIGPAIMDLPRFILNELDTEHSCSDRQHIEEVIRQLGKQSGYPAADIVKLFYMETVLGNIWRLEDGEDMDRQELDIASSLLLHESDLKFLQLLPEEIKKHPDDLPALRECLIRFRDHGMDRHSMLQNMEKLRKESDSETEEILLDLMDFVAGWCAPGISLYDLNI